MKDDLNHTTRRPIGSTPIMPTPNELAWKDTIQSPPEMITVVRVRFAPQSSPLTGPRAPTPGVNLYPFDPTCGPSYVWHCHIVDHEDNEMMRPTSAPNPSLFLGLKRELCLATHFGEKDSLA